MIEMTFGQRVERLRKIKGLTQQEVADRAGIGLGSVSKYERLNDAGSIGFGFLQRLAVAFEIEVGQLTAVENDSAGALEAMCSREALRRFLAKANLKPSDAKKLILIQDDAAAPKSTDQWADFWRLVQGMGGRPLPRQGDERVNAPNERPPRTSIRVVHSRPLRTTKSRKRLSVA